MAVVLLAAGSSRISMKTDTATKTHRPRRAGARMSMLHAYAPITMVPRKPNDNPGEIKRFGNHVDTGGGIDCDESGPFGTYRWKVANSQLTLTAIHEPCGQRRAVYEGTWTRVN